jgi:hypothetical protein
MKRTIKLVLAASLLTISANAAAMPSKTPDRYYEQQWSWVFTILGLHRPCVGPANAVCGG